MRVEDYYPGGKRWWVRLHEKGGKRHEMPAHHKLEQFLDEYLAAAGIRENGKTPSSVLTDKPMNRVDAYRMVRRRTADAGFRVKLGCHVFRATGVTADLELGGECPRKRHRGHARAARSQMIRPELAAAIEDLDGRRAVDKPHALGNDGRNSGAGNGERR
jgi:hypothetical protein